MSLSIEFHIPKEVEDLYRGDEIDRRINERELNRFMVYLVQTGVIDSVSGDPKITIESKDNVPPGKMLILIGGKTIPLDLSTINWPQ